MPLVKQTLQTELETLFTTLQSQTDTASGVKNLASGLATAIDNYIKTGTVIVQPGIGVQVAVPAGTGSTVTPGEGTIE